MTAENVVDLFGNLPEEIFKEDEQSDLYRIGRYAEFMVCAQLTKAGYDVFHVDTVGFDLILKHPQGTFTIQVKSSRQTQNGKGQKVLWKTVARSGSANGKRYARPLTRADAHLLALHSTEYETTIVLPITNNMPSQFAFSISQVEHASIDQTLKAAIAYLLAEIE